MQHKHVMFIADSLDNAYKFQAVLSDLGVDVDAGSSLQFGRLLASMPSCDLVIYELRDAALDSVATIERALLEHGGIPLLLIVRPSLLDKLSLPIQVRSDFCVTAAEAAECRLRIQSLLWPASDRSTSEIITVDSMTINLATYQVQVAGNPIDLTYLEYALLSFLVTHPGRTYSRDALLKRVWGFDYYGGSRTVDVHVRRVRAKLGPELAQHLETVRGVGYLWD
ncbi:MAG: winged-helix domain-containing protein [Eggerthellaceae bacterium]|nr:winged-helix domain-containing protein [Eggerthellaceae bacterium]